MGLGDIWWPFYDFTNMQTGENQLVSLYRMVGPGVLEGWDVSSMGLTGDSSGDAALVSERLSLSSAAVDSVKAQQYGLVGSPTTEDDWRQVIKVTSGSGIVGLYAARTPRTYYFRFRTDGIYYAWAENSLCLATDGICAINAPLDGDELRDQRFVATYLATIEVTTHPTSGLPWVSLVTYEDRRQQLKNLAGALRKALARSFYRHVHAGGSDHPSKINLSTCKVLDGVGPLGSTIFDTFDEKGLRFSWPAADFGIPEVRVDERTLSQDSYTISATAGRIFLKNSVRDGARVQIVLPLASMVALAIHEDYSISSPIVYLTDGTTSRDDEGDSTQRIYTWDDAYYHPLVLSIAGSVVDPSLYTVNSSAGSVVFNAPLDFDPPLTSYGNAQVSVILTHIGNEIVDKLDGSRIGSLDASTFTRGSLDIRRIGGLSHVGENRFKQPAVLRPSMRLFSEGDHFTFYPEIEGSELQYGTDVHVLFASQNVAGTLLGTKRGLMQTDDFQKASLVESWVVDNGQPNLLIDDLVPVKNENHFKTLYVLTIEGRVFLTRDSGSSFQPLKKPVDSNPVPLSVNAFWVSTKRDEVVKGFFVDYEYSTNLFLGTDRGLYTATVQEGQTQDDWVWTKTTRYRDSGGNLIDESLIGAIHAIAEVVTISTSTNATTGEVKETFSNTLYVGCDAGLFIGGGGELKQQSSFPVKGIFWIKNGISGINQNDIVWYSDTAAKITHSAYLYADGNGNTQWYAPLTTTSGALYSVRVATAASIDLSGGLVAVDGVQVAEGDRVLVKNQGTTSVPSSQVPNGLYVAHASGWVRTTDVLHALDRVSVAEGATNGGSIWFLPVEPSSYTLGTTPVDWKIWEKTIYFDPSTHITSVLSRTGYSDYFVLNSAGISLVRDTNVDGNAPLISVVPWNVASQGSPSYALSQYSSEFDLGVLLVSTNRGLWKSNARFWTNDSQAWGRIPRAFAQSDELTVWAESPLEEVEGYTKDESSQAVAFVSVRKPWQNYLWERQYTTFYVDPWSVGSEVVVYIGAEQSVIPYSLTPTEGKITFGISLTKAESKQVRVTITRVGAFIGDVGLNPHGEQRNVYVVEPLPATKLSQKLTPSDLTLVLEDSSVLDSTVRYVELRSGSVHERITVSVSSSHKVTLPYPRTSTYSFPAGSQVHIVSLKSVLGIEDIITKGSSNEPYHLNSVAGGNVIQLALTAQTEYPNLFDNFSTSPMAGTEVDRGPRNAIFINGSTSFDPRASSSSLTEALEPSDADNPLSPRVGYAIHHPAVNGEGMYLGTDEGVWTFQSGAWKKESSVDDSARIYYLQSLGSGLILGSDKGLYRRSAEGSWSLDPAFPQTSFVRLSGDWFGGTFEAFGKEDGLAFVYSKAGVAGFTSDHFDAVDGKRVYGLYKDQFIRLSEDSQGNLVQTPTDALYLCTEDGLYGVTSGDRKTPFSSLLIGREMFGKNPLKLTVSLPDGGIATVPVKIYRIFRPVAADSDSKPPIPIIILTSNGVYKVLDWRWGDPADPSTPDFSPITHALSGVSCLCFCQNTAASTATSAAVTKIFVGTAEGVYRSYSQGNSWERCERIGGGSTAVYDLVTVGVGILAATEAGLYYSNDDGDTWLRPQANSNGTAEFDPDVDSLIGLAGGYLAQTFHKPAGVTQITKVALYIARAALADDDPQLGASMSNTLEAHIFSVNGSGLPLADQGYSVSGTITNLISAGYLPQGYTSPDLIRAENVEYPGFRSVYLPVTLPSAAGTYAIVVREKVADGARPVLQLQTSTRQNPYAGGEACNGGTTPSWSYLTTARDKDFFFRVYFQASATPTVTNEAVGYVDSTVGWFDGNSRGLTVKDDGSLTTDFKLALSLTVDNSLSQAWSDPGGRKPTELRDLIDTLWARFHSTVSSQDYYAAYVDYWQFGTSILERSSGGYTNDLDAIRGYINTLTPRGGLSELYDAADQAVAGLNPEAILESIQNGSDFAAKVDQIVQYHLDRDILRLVDISSWYTNQRGLDNWDGTAGGISTSPEVSEFFLRRWAESFIPFILIVADGDGNGSAEDLASNANSAWDGEGVSVNALGTGRSARQTGLRDVTSSTAGLYFDISNGSNNADWDTSKISFLHGGDNTIFEGTWARAYDFTDPAWIRSVNSSHTSPTATIDSFCSVEVRWSIDRIHYNTWQTISSGVPLIVETEVLAIEYRAVLRDGWDGSAPVKPSITNLYHIEVIPAKQYLISPTYASKGMLFEYLLRSDLDTPLGSKAKWGIVRGDSTDFADFELIRMGRNGALANRQQSIQFTSRKLRERLLTSDTGDHQTFQVIENNIAASWTSSDIVSVYFEGSDNPIDPDGGAYALNMDKGQVYFFATQPVGLVVTVNILTPSKLYTSYGESTSTVDGRTYRLSNGRWPHDASIIVLVNGHIRRGGYFSNNEEGTVTFASELERTDLVTVFVQHSDVFRVGLELSNYSSGTVLIEDFGLEYTARKNTRLTQQYTNTAAPSLSNLRLDPSGATIYDRLTLSYEFVSSDSNEESGTKTTWWRSRPGDSTSYPVVQDGFAQITTENGLPNYNNRTVQRKSDVGIGGLFAQGDLVKVMVVPSDGINEGSPATTPVITLNGNKPPFIRIAIINAVGKIQNTTGSYVGKGVELRARYVFNNADGGGDVDLDGVAGSSTVRWYDHDSIQPIYVGPRLPASTTVRGQVISFTVTPYDGQSYGSPVRSDDVVVN